MQINVTFIMFKFFSIAGQSMFRDPYEDLKISENLACNILSIRPGKMETIRLVLIKKKKRHMSVIAKSGLEK